MTFLSQKFMITRSSIAFEDFLGSSIAPQVMPPWSRKKVSVSENLVSEEQYRFRFGKNLVSEKRFGFGKFGIVKKSLRIGFGQNFGIVIQCCEPEDANKKRDKSNSTEEEDDIKEDAFSGLTTSVWVGTGAKVSPQQVLNFKILKQVC